MEQGGLNDLDELESYLKTSHVNVVEALQEEDEWVRRLREDQASSCAIVPQESVELEPGIRLIELADKGKRVSVVVQGRNGPRRELTGRMMMFDIHWNLVLQDVMETFFRPKKVRIFLTDSSTSTEVVPEQLRYDHVAKVSSNLEVVQRKLKCIFIRGRTIVAIHQRKPNSIETVLDRARVWQRNYFAESVKFV